MTTQVESLSEFTRRFATVEACLEHLEALRWKDGEFCPHCGKKGTIYHYSDGRRHRCAECRWVFRITTGTVFSNSPISKLPQWFAAIYLVTEHSEGISSVQLAKDIGVTQKTAWRMIQRIRNAAKLTNEGILTGSRRYRCVSPRRQGAGQAQRRANSSDTGRWVHNDQDRRFGIERAQRSH